MSGLGVLESLTPLSASSKPAEAPKPRGVQKLPAHRPPDAAHQPESSPRFNFNPPLRPQCMERTRLLQRLLSFLYFLLTAPMSRSREERRTDTTLSRQTGILAATTSLAESFVELLGMCASIQATGLGPFGHILRAAHTRRGDGRHPTQAGDHGSAQKHAEEPWEAHLLPARHHAASPEARSRILKLLHLDPQRAGARAGAHLRHSAQAQGSLRRPQGNKPAAEGWNPKPSSCPKDRPVLPRPLAVDGPGSLCPRF